MTEMEATYEAEKKGVESLRTENDDRRDPYNYYGPMMQPDQFAKPPLEQVGLYYQPEQKAVIEMGGLSIYLTKRYNRFHRFMMRLVFGWKVTNVE